MMPLLFAPFVSNDPSHRLLIANSQNGITKSGGVDTGFKTQQPPAMIYSKGQYLLFFAQETSASILCVFSQDGISWKGNISPMLADCIGGPSATVLGDFVWVAYLNSKDTSKVDLRFMYKNSGPWKIAPSLQIPKSATYPASSAPRIATFQGKLWLTYTYEDQVYITSSADGETWTPAVPTGLLTRHPAAVVSYFDKLFIAVRDLSTRIVKMSSSVDGTQWTSPIDTVPSDSAPTFAIFEQRLWMSFVSDRIENNQRYPNSIQLSWSPDAVNWSVPTPMNVQTSPFAPALCSPFTATGTVSPAYQIVTVVYAPPGTQGGGSGSMIEYGTGSSLSTVVSDTKSFKENTTISTSVGIGGSSIGAEFGITADESESNSIDIKKSSTWNLQVTGPSLDGIHHGYDIFYLWLNPQLRVFAVSDADLVTQLGVEGPTMTIQYVYASWLENPDTMPPGLKTILTNAGFQDDDFKAILATNPLTNPSLPFDTNRYLPTTQSFPYIPPKSVNDKPPSFTYTQQSVVTTSKTKTSEASYQVSYKTTAGVKGIIEASLSNEKKLQWTNSSSKTSSSTSTQQATVTVSGPSFNYTGPTDVLVYWDTVFSSFAFRFPDTPPTYSGALADSSGVPLPSEPVSLHVDGKELTTHTDANGGFRFYNTISPQGEVAIRSNKTPVTLAPGQPVASHTV